MSKSLEALERMKADLIKIQCELFDDDCNDERVLAVYQLEDYQTIKQDLEAYEQLKQDHDKTLINNGELCVKVTDLQKENQELVVNKNLAQKLAVEYKNNIDKLEKENQKLKEELQLTETARQLIYNELKCCSGMSEYIEKLKKVIEIIKNHDIKPINHLGCLRFGYNEYNCHLTQQEYDLLKEVLENER